MQGLSERQRTILQYIHERFQEEGILPSYREIGDAMGIKSTNGVSDHIRALERKGYLSRVGRSGKGALARAMALTDKALEEFGTLVEDRLLPLVEGLVEIPVFGRVNAGAPALAFEHREETLHVDSCMIPGGGKVFALRVNGESMILDGILPGDYLFIRKQLTVRNGKIAVVMVDGESTVKRFYREGDRIRLQPANDTMSPIYVDASDFKAVNIIGVVVGVYRKLA
jgi:repressor LexA